MREQCAQHGELLCCHLCFLVIKDLNDKRKFPLALSVSHRLFEDWVDDTNTMHYLSDIQSSIGDLGKLRPFRKAIFFTAMLPESSQKDLKGRCNSLPVKNSN